VCGRSWRVPSGLQSTLTLTPSFIPTQCEAELPPIEIAIPAPPKGYSGVYVSPLNAGLRRQLGIGNQPVLDVLFAPEGSPASRAGLQAEDLIVEFLGKPVTDRDAFNDAVESLAPGTPASLVYLRDGKRMPVTMTVGERP